MRNIKKGDTVTIHYTGKFEDDQVFDSSKGRDPLEFVVGEGQIIVGVEKAVIGMHMGEAKTVKLNPSEAYGDRRDDLVSTVEKKYLSPDMDPKPGTQWLIGDPQDPTIVTVLEANDENITLDANHPLAGKMLIFDLEIIAIA
ncbi:MAG: peptidylprolyl isomerase [Chlamydiae bacterium]|nr:peptidylprolyl isomerase [Chlamydiota bacterium]